MADRLVDYFFSKDHEWIRKSSSDTNKIGISDFAQHELGDIVYVEIDTLGQRFQAGDIFGNVEAVKTVSDLYAPVDCEIVAVNEQLRNSPEIINHNPYGDGWMVEVKPIRPEDINKLMNFLQYRAMVYGEEVLKEELIHIVYLDESNKIHYVPAFRGQDGQIILQKEDAKSVIVQSFITAANLLKEQLIEEFEYLLNKSDLKEHEMQKFFEEHPEFLLGTDYEALHPQVVLKTAEEELRPDFILKPLSGTSYRPNIVEIKLPNQKIEKLTPRREGLYANIYEAVAQLRAYSRYFDEKENREYLRRELGFTTYRPTLTLIIGRDIEVGDEKLRDAIMDSLSPINLITYTDILLKYKAMIKKL